MQLISPQHYMDCFAGFFLQDCAVINRNCVSFVMRSLEDTTAHDSLEEQLVGKRVIWQTIAGTEDLTGGFSLIRNSEEIYTVFADGKNREMLYINAHGLVLAYDADGFRQERRISEAAGIPQRGFFALTAKTIGRCAYICGHRGLVAYRIQKDVWNTISLPQDTFSGPPLMLLDIDGFAPDDVYVVSSKAGVFHFNGERWRRIAFPSNILLETVCCGGDGKVYISGQRGTLFAGRGNRWERVHEGDLTIPFKDTVWYQDALWCTNDYGVWTFKDMTFERAPVPDEVYFCSGHLSTRDGLLLIGGMNGAALYNGSEWQPLYYQMEILAGMLENEG